MIKGNYKKYRAKDLGKVGMSSFRFCLFSTYLNLCQNRIYEPN